ncbi:hypothetical protein MVEN_01318400 [Mycena venus]|uniref:Extracellular membrane protein CFEM domain-containing protein n=1 Tax=Mycena venus TaxID=2733690 RepID=A0A8H6Y0I2_9AGAR|nr:hypothetical protein MVEN_01318400 [Mycena venus]
MRLQTVCAAIPSLALALAPIFLFSLPAASALILPRGDINPDLIPPACVSTCQAALSFQSKCGPTDFKCRCTDANGDSVAQCMDCVVGNLTDGSNTLAQSAAQGVLSDYATECAKNDVPISSLTLSLAPEPTASTTSVRTSDAHMIIHNPRLIVTGLLALALTSWGLVAL